MKGHTKLGVALTATWLLVVSALLMWKVDSLCCLTLNEWGDFLAGATAPIAFMWLVIGYAQHGSELAEQVKHMEKLAEAEERRARLDKQSFERQKEREEKEAQPIFVLTKATWTREHSTQEHSERYKAELLLRNTGGSAYNVRLMSYLPTSYHLWFDKDSWLDGRDVSFVIDWSGLKGTSPGKLTFILMYTDILGDRVGQALEYEYQGDHLKVTDRFRNKEEIVKRIKAGLRPVVGR